MALQRDNLEMGNVAPQDISKQVPAWSILTSAYLFRDANHLNAFFASDLGAQMKKMAEDQLKVKILGPTFFGTRHVGLKTKKKINTPADLAGIKLRMPPGDAWQLLGRSLGANPTPMAYAETYTGAADRRRRRAGQPAAQRAEHEVQRGDVADRADFAPGRLRPADGEPEDLDQHAAPRSRRRSRPPRTRRIAWSTAEHLKREAELAEGFRKAGLEVYAPDINAFREHAQKMYLASDEAKEWPPGHARRRSTR